MAFLLRQAVLSPLGNCSRKLSLQSRERATVPCRSLLHPSPSPNTHSNPTEPRGRKESKWEKHEPAAVPLFPAPDQGPRCACTHARTQASRQAGNSNNLSNASPQWGPAPANASLLSRAMAHLQFEHKTHLERVYLFHQIEPEPRCRTDIALFFCFSPTHPANAISHEQRGRHQFGSMFREQKCSRNLLFLQKGNMCRLWCVC